MAWRTVDRLGGRSGYSVRWSWQRANGTSQNGRDHDEHTRSRGPWQTSSLKVSDWQTTTDLNLIRWLEAWGVVIVGRPTLRRTLDRTQSGRAALSGWTGKVAVVARSMLLGIIAAFSSGI